MATLTHERIKLVINHLTTAITAASGNQLPVAEQRRLAQACCEAGDLLRDWQAGDRWKQVRRASQWRVRDTFLVPGGFAPAGPAPAGASLSQSVDVLLTTMLNKAAPPVRSGITLDLVGAARAAVEAETRINGHWRQVDLCRDAEIRLGNLQLQICELAASLRSIAPGSRRGRMARIRAVRLLAGAREVARIMLVLPVLSAGPAPAGDVAGSCLYDAARVVALFLLGDLAQRHAGTEPAALLPLNGSAGEERPDNVRR